MPKNFGAKSRVDEGYMESMEKPSHEHDAHAEEVLDSLGVSEGKESEIDQSHDSIAEESPNNSNDPLYVQKRLKQQKRSHDREIRELHARIAGMQDQLSSNAPNVQQHAIEVQPNNGQVDEQIHKAVAFALNHREMEERKSREMANNAHIEKQYRAFYNHLDQMSDKYDDFHDAVMGPDSRFTPAMRDYALTLPRNGKGSAGEVLYQLGKNPEELSRIATLHPLDQATEMAKLSHALALGGDSKVSQSNRPMLGNIKSNPVTNSRGITEKTPPSEIRARMKSGTWK